MPLLVEIDHQKRFVTITATGLVVLQDILDYFDRLIAGNAMPYPKLFDARSCEASFSDQDIRIVGAKMLVYAAYDPRGPVAMVAPKGAMQDLLRSFLAAAGPSERPAMIFDRLEDAHGWLLAFPMR
ncbi:MAG TPA: hypothetical protein VMI56_28565 [Reyranella sp.]|nr:hypothetical protein [Reyranella sp.]